MSGARTALDEAEIRARLAQSAPRWSYDGAALSRSYRTADFRSAMLAANAVGHLAEAAWHHPDIDIRYNALRLRLTTHDAGGVTKTDLSLARDIEDLLTARTRPDGAPPYILDDDATLSRD